MGENALTAANLLAHTGEPQPQGAEAEGEDYPSNALCDSLIEAAKIDSSQAAAQLLDKGANPNYRHPSNYYDASPLLVAARCRSVGVLRLLLQRGADPNMITRKSTGWTALHKAKSCVVRDLIEAGADPHLTDRDGNPPLLHWRVGEVCGGRCLDKVRAMVEGMWVRGEELDLHQPSTSEPDFLDTDTDFSFWGSRVEDDAIEFFTNTTAVDQEKLVLNARD